MTSLKNMFMLVTAVSRRPRAVSRPFLKSSCVTSLIHMFLRVRDVSRRHEAFQLSKAISGEYMCVTIIVISLLRSVCRAF